MRGIATSAVDQMDREQRLDDVIAAYLEQLEVGRESPAEEWIARHPEFRDELTRFFRQRASLERRVAPLRAITQTPVASYVQRLGDFEIVREIGRGGMGVVYEAQQISLSRRVALKVLPLAALLDERQLARFHNEAQAAALLRHPHIVGVHCVGYERGVHYYAMELIEGLSLAKLLAECRREKEANADSPTCVTRAQAETILSGSKPNDFHSVVRLGIQVAEALEYAHQMGVVHRDIKPSNLLVDTKGHVWITDFGLAQIQTDQSLTRTGDLVGTLRYMSPEQASGRRAVLDQRSDVYSLGVTLYELVTKQPAFPDDDRQMLLRRIAEEDPSPPSKLNAKIPRDLETIILKAIAKSPTDRYQSAAELAEDLRRFLEHRPIQARRVRLLTHLHRWIQRHRLLTAFAATLVLGLLIASIASYAVALKYAALAGREQQARQLADQNRRDAQELLASSMTAVSESLNYEPKLFPLRKQLLTDSAAYYEQLLSRSSNDPAIRFEAGVAYRRLGRMHEMTDFDAEAAHNSFNRAIEILEELVDEDPRNPEYRIELARAIGCLSDSLATDPRDLVEYCRRAVAIYEALPADSPTDDEFVARQASARVKLGFRLGNVGELAEAAEIIAAAERAAGKLTTQWPEDHDIPLLWSWCKQHAARIQLESGNPSSAETLLHDAAEIAGDHAAQAGPEYFTEYKIGGAEHTRTLGRLLVCQRKFANAISEFEAAEEDLKSLLVEVPRHRWARELLGEVLIDHSMALVSQGRLADAETKLRDALRRWDEDPEIRKRNSHLIALATFRLGQILHAIARVDESRVCFQDLQQGQALVSSETAGNSPASIDLADVLLTVTCPLVEFRDSKFGVVAARAMFNSQDPRRWQLLGLAQYRAGDWPAARDSLHEAIKRRSYDDAFDWLLLSIVLHQLGESDEAQRSYDKAMASYEGPITFLAFGFLFELDALRAEAEELLGRSSTNE